MDTPERTVLHPLRSAKAASLCSRKRLGGQFYWVAGGECNLTNGLS
jgi:hypothetical protein